MDGEEDTRLTPRQAEVIRSIYEHLTEYGYSPTLEEIATRMGIPCGRSGVFQHVGNLVKKGWLEVRGPRFHRQLVLRGMSMRPYFDGSSEAKRLVKLLEVNNVH